MHCDKHMTWVFFSFPTHVAIFVPLDQSQTKPMLENTSIITISTPEYLFSVPNLRKYTIKGSMHYDDKRYLNIGWKYPELPCEAT